MRKSAAIFLVLIVCTFVSCKKESFQTSQVQARDVSVSNQSTNILSGTVYGLDYKVGGVYTIQSKLNIAGLSLARNQLMLSIKTKGSFIDKYIESGYNVQINLNWANTNGAAVAFPTDTNKIKARAETFFRYYQPYISQIPVVVVENEWDNTAFHKGEISDYLTELRIITDIGHKYGFKIADGGLSSTNLRRWTFSQLSDDAAEIWKDNYFVGDKLDSYGSVISTVNNYAQAVKNIPIDYLNVHWYNIEECFNGFSTAAQAYLKACGKERIMTNEFGIKTDSDLLFSQTVEELRNVSYFAIAYSGTGGENKAASLTDEMLKAF